MTQQILILGTGGNSLDILDSLVALGAPYVCLGFLDDNEALHGTEVCGLPVLGGLSRAASFPKAMLVNGIGSPESFRRKAEIIARTGAAVERFAAVVHPTASIGPRVTLGRGAVILQNVTVAGNAIVGDHVMVLPGSVISHDSVLGDRVTVSAGVCVSGGVTVGDGAYIGSNSTLRNGVSVGAGAMVGMGCVVLNDVEADTTVVGNPARVLRPS